MFELKLVDDIVPEPPGGAHNDPTTIAKTLKQHLLNHLSELLALPAAERLKKRYEKFRAYGQFLEKPLPRGEKADSPKKTSKRVAVATPATAKTPEPPPLSTAAMKSASIAAPPPPP